MKPRYWALITLLLWGGIILASGLLRFDAYGLEEGAARAIVLGWSVADKIISTAFVMGFPDLRVLLFIPLGLYWPGSMLAVKIFTMLITFAAVMLFHNWVQRRHGSESALLGSGLLLIAPLTISQIDAVGTGPYLLLAFALGMWLDQAYRKAQRPLSGWYFLQLLLICFTVSLHPAGLAYPLALIWEWHQKPLDQRQQRHIYIGIGIALTLALLLRGGWGAQSWFNNPIITLSGALLGLDGDIGEAALWTTGVILAALLGILLLLQRRQWLQELPARILALAVIIGAVTGDAAWGLLALATLLYLGIPALITFNQTLGTQGLMGQRGLVLFILFISATLFMQGDKAHYQRLAANLLNPQDQLIQAFALELENRKDEHFLAMSQWPGRTMLALHRPVLPLPPAYSDEQTLLKKIAGTTHLIFEPFDPANKQLSSQLAR
ncbi:MAG: hypothetical protein ACE5ET_00420, partial [Gammaproteobacteria bacterium]